MLHPTKIDPDSCAACGTSPVNHTFMLTLNFLDGIMSQVDKVFMGITKAKGWDGVARLVEKFLFYTLSLVGIVRFNTSDTEKTVTGRSKLIWDEAIKRGIQMEQVMFLWKPIEYYRAKIDGPHKDKWFYFHSIPIPSDLPQRGYTWLDDKFVLADKLTTAGIPSPKTKKVSSIQQAEKMFALMEKPLIIKPKFGSRGRHTTTNINTLLELKKAFDLATQITFGMVLQEHLFGSVYRATVINNKLVGFYRADPPQVVGNGKDTIKQLIEYKNNHHHERVSEIRMNADLDSFIARKGYSLENILPADEVLDLSAKTGRMYGSYTREMLPEVHPKMHEIFRKAGAVCDAPVLGFDLIITDPTADPDTQKWGIIECNSMPFIDLHFFALEGPKINLAENVWDLWKK